MTTITEKYHFKMIKKEEEIESFTCNQLKNEI